MMLRGAAGRMQPWMHSVSSLGGAPVTVLSSARRERAWWAAGSGGRFRSWRPMQNCRNSQLDFRAVLLDGEIASRKLQGLIQSR
jgi:hypothetical protein